MIGTGDERFAGCVDVDLDEVCAEGEPSGELFFDYVQWTTFDPATGDLVEGNCTHPVTGGTGDFEGARGIVTMHDVPVDGEVRTTYQGTVVLDAVAAGPQAARGAAAQGFAVDAAAVSPGHC